MNTRNTTYENLLSQAVGMKMNLPMQPMIEFSPAGDDLKCVVVRLSESAVCENMQTNAAAYESWIIALKVWGVVDRAILKWDRPKFAPVIEGEEPSSHWCHYQRFLYRANFFRRLFGNDWFNIDTAQHLEECEALKPENTNPSSLILNVPDKDCHGKPSDQKQEALLEEAFVSERHGKQGLLWNKFNLQSVNRQLPVGLFKGEKSAATRIFTGGASAIDLVGLGNDNSLWIFELKKKGNTALGVISELMFYSACMRDLRDGNFKLHDGRVGKRWDGNIHDIAKKGTVNAVFLLPEVHRLFRERRDQCLALLNDACSSLMIDIQFHFQSFDYEFPDTGFDEEMPIIKLSDS